MMPDSYYALHEDNESRNYLWFYNVEERDSIPYFNIDVNKNCPIRPEADFTYGLGDNINIVGRSSFSSGMGNQNMGWYSATMGRFNTAYYAGFALGAYNKALGTYSVALNQMTEATATGATSKGYLTKATANYAEAGGQQTEANHKASFTHGLGTKSGRQHQAVVGEYNEENKTALFVVGNGSGGQIKTITQEYKYLDWQKTNLGYTNIVPGSLSTTSDYFPLKDDGEGHIGYNNNNSDNFIIIGNIDYSTGIIHLTDAPMFASSYNQTTTFKYYLGDNGIVRSNAFEVEKDGSAIIGKTGAKENSVATKGYVDSQAEDIIEATTEAIEIAKNQLTAQDAKIVEAMVDTFLRKDYAGLETAETVSKNVPIVINDNVVRSDSNTDDLLN
jgi:hypothetical protein